MLTFKKLKLLFTVAFVVHSGSVSSVMAMKRQKKFSTEKVTIQVTGHETYAAVSLKEGDGFTQYTGTCHNGNLERVTLHRNVCLAFVFFAGDPSSKGEHLYPAVPKYNLLKTLFEESNNKLNSE